MHSWLIGITTAAGYEHRRRACVSTWAKARPGVDIVFIIGNPHLNSPARAGDTLMLPCPDTYPELPQKSRAFFQWAASQFSWTCLLKCDDDTYIVLDRLQAYEPTGDYVGCEPGGKWRGYGSGGAGYMLSRRVTEYVAKNLTCPRGPEDKLVGECIAQMRPRVPFTNDPRFSPWSVRTGIRPHSANDVITAHVGGGEAQWKAHGEKLFNDLAREFSA